MTHDFADRLLRPGDTCWRVEMASKIAVIVDADEYFRMARAAMCKARRRIVMVGWDFDARIELQRSESSGEGPMGIAPFVEWLVERNDDLDVYLLRWDLGVLKTLFQGSTILAITRWMRRKRIHIKLDGHHPTGASHHLKIVVIDDDIAFCGGIDMTDGRWDTRDHRDDDPRRRLINGRPYPPWHDATTALQGPVAAALGELCAERWERAGGEPMAKLSITSDCWPDDLVPQFKAMPVGIARTQPPMPGFDEVVEIERLYIDLIASARTTIYAESQYFASRKIALAIAKRLDEPNGPEVVIVNPLKARGWLEPIAMDTARGQFVEALRQRDRHDRFRVYYPVTEGGTPIYVHAKILIIDDRVLRIGSSNMNNRSMRLDTECDVAIDAAVPHNPQASDAIVAFRDSLIGEHLGVPEDAVADAIERTGSLIAAIEALRRTAGRSLRPLEQADPSAVELWLSENEILDPEGPQEMFEVLTRRTLFRGWRD